MPNEMMKVIIEEYPWIKEKGQKLIISPDSDGFLSALLLMNYFDAEVVGYYDCKVMLCDASIDPKTCTFVDLDIFCKDIRSVGHHMVCYNRNDLPNNWYHYDNCIQINNIRCFDSSHDFQRKYPFATVHFLLSLLESEAEIALGDDSIIPLLFCDGVCNNLFGYPENCLDWFEWLNADKAGTLLNGVFYKGIPFSSVMKKMDSFFRERDRYNSRGYLNTLGEFEKKSQSRSGHHMRLTLKEGTPINIVGNNKGNYDIFEPEKKRTLGFVSLIADYMGWKAMKEKWRFSNLKLYKFSKGSIGSSGGNGLRLNQKTYKSIVEGNCFSMAITAGSTIEYTLDNEGYFRR